MECDEILTLLDNELKHFNDDLDWMERNCMKMQEKYEKRTNEIINSLEFIQAKLDEALAKLKKVSDERKEYSVRIQSLTQKNHELRTQISSYESCMGYLDD